MKRSSPLALIPGLVVAASAVGHAQDPSQTQPTFRSSVALVRVDISVTGRDDAPVTDLQASDFEIDEDGIPQAVETVQFVSLDGTRTTDLGESLEIRSPEHAAAEAARDDVRVFAIFLDDYHVDWNPEIASRAKRELKELLKQIGPNDLVTIMDPLTPLSALRFTRSIDDLQVRIDRFEGRRGRSLPPRNAAEAEQQGQRNVIEIRAGVTISALSALVSHLGGLREGRKSVLFVSQGPPTFPGSPNEKGLREVLQAANRGNVTIHVYDPQPFGFAGRGGRDVLQRLRTETGGREFFNANGTAERMRQVVTDASAYYLVGYSPTRALADGKFHRIDVRVKREGVRVLARNGYWAPTAEEVNAPDPTPAEPGLADALAALATPVTGRAADVWIGATRGPESTTRLTVSWDPADAADVSRPARLTVEPLDSATQEPIGDLQSILNAAAVSSDSPSAATFHLRPGTSFLLRFSALAADGEILERWTKPVTVPALGGGGLVMGTPRVFRAQTAFEARALAAGTDRAPSATRRFRTTDRVVVEVECYAAGADTPSVAAHLLNGKGETLVELPVPPVSGGKTRLTLPISSLAPSTYVLRLTASAGDSEIQQRVAFQVVR
ncbi:MAG: VWA domain-containing protein [Acidobacteria bacterium]|nr:VWA domain-containing protein [Acidobacteriota bacterium]